MSGDGRLQMLPPAEHLCPICAVEHEADLPHNAQSMYYQMRFKEHHGRHPTWADASAHCSTEMRSLWKEELLLRGAWTEPEDGNVIAEPLHDAIRQIVSVGEPPRRIPWPPKEVPEEADEAGD